MSLNKKYYLTNFNKIKLGIHLKSQSLLTSDWFYPWLAPTYNQALTLGVFETEFYCLVKASSFKMYGSCWDMMIITKKDWNWFDTHLSDEMPGCGDRGNK